MAARRQQQLSALTLVSLSGTDSAQRAQTTASLSRLGHRPSVQLPANQQPGLGGGTATPYSRHRTPSIGAALPPPDHANQTLYEKEQQHPDISSHTNERRLQISRCRENVRGAKYICIYKCIYRYRECCARITPLREVHGALLRRCSVQSAAVSEGVEGRGSPYSSVRKETAGVAAPSPMPDWAATHTKYCVLGYRPSMVCCSRTGTLIRRSSCGHRGQRSHDGVKMLPIPVEVL